METGTFPSLALPSSFHHSNHHHRGLYRPIYVIKKDLSNELRPFLFYGWLTINSKSCPSKVQASTSLGRIKWLTFLDWIVFPVNSELTLTSQDTEQAVVSCLFKVNFSRNFPLVNCKEIIGYKKSGT